MEESSGDVAELLTNFNICFPKASFPSEDNRHIGRMACKDKTKLGSLQNDPRVPPSPPGCQIQNSRWWQTSLPRSQPHFFWDTRTTGHGILLPLSPHFPHHSHQPVGASHITGVSRAAPTLPAVVSLWEELVALSDCISLLSLGSLSSCIPPLSTHKSNSPLELSILSFNFLINQPGGDSPFSSIAQKRVNCTWELDPSACSSDQVFVILTLLGR